eukprot:3183804-Amphidinium_carterae.1
MHYFVVKQLSDTEDLYSKLFQTESSLYRCVIERVISVTVCLVLFQFVQLGSIPLNLAVWGGKQALKCASNVDVLEADQTKCPQKLLSEEGTTQGYFGGPHVGQYYFGYYYSFQASP